MFAFCIIIDLFMIYECPICDVFHWFCKIARFFATEPTDSLNFFRNAGAEVEYIHFKIKYGSLAKIKPKGL